MLREKLQPDAGPLPIAEDINFVTNELIENAFKFHAGGHISLAAGIWQDQFVVWVSNQLHNEVACTFCQTVERFTQGGPTTSQMIKKLSGLTEHNDDDSRSGLGMLLLASDYGVQFAWEFLAEGAHTTVTVMAQLPLAKR